MTRFGIIGMLACVVMQYIRTGIISEIADWGWYKNYGQAWYLPPIATLIGLGIGIVSVAACSSSV